MGRFFNVVSPFATNLIDRVYLFKSNHLPALHVSKMLGYEKYGKGYRLAKYTVDREPRKVPGERQQYKCFIHFDDLPKLMQDLGRDPEDLKMIFEPAALPIKKRDSSADSDQVLQKSAEVPAEVQEILRNPRKRDRDEETNQLARPTDFIQEFAKRYLAEHPDEAQKLIIDTIVKKYFDEINKKLE